MKKKYYKILNMNNFNLNKIYNINSQNKILNKFNNQIKIKN